MGDGRMILLTLTWWTLVFLSPSFSTRGKWVAEAQIHHVVGDDRGWDRSSNVASWAARRIFRVGDFIWFAYSAAEENIVELGSRDEYESCDVANPVTMYTDGLSKVSLEGVGVRYFASGSAESCKEGLRLPVEVRPKSWVPPNPSQSKNPLQYWYSSHKDVLAAAPSTPSDATRVFNGVGFGTGGSMTLTLFAGTFLFLVCGCY